MDRLSLILPNLRIAIIFICIIILSVQFCAVFMVISKCFALYFRNSLMLIECQTKSARGNMIMLIVDIKMAFPAPDP